MKKALLVGIDAYERSPLEGCEADARLVETLLRRNADGSPNFHCRLLVSSESEVDQEALLKALEELFEGGDDTRLFYFAGHGARGDAGPYILPSNAKDHLLGIPMSTIRSLAEKSKSREVLVILDCCYAGGFGNNEDSIAGQAEIRSGMSILAATRPTERASEVDGHGVFTTLLCAALEGGAADILGRVTMASIYAYIDRALGAWHQRPTFKAHLSTFSSIRDAKEGIEPAILRLLPEYFETADTELELDPSYEPSEQPRDEKNERTFRHLQTLRDNHLLVPVGEDALYYAAVNSKACKLTRLGRYYWQLAKDGLI